MNIVIPMAGLGTRFRNVGYTIAKPLIPVWNKPMYAWAVDSLPVEYAHQLIFVLLRSQPSYRELRNDIVRRYSKYKPLILDVPKLTEGQAVTVLQAKRFINNNDPLLIHNCDTAFEIDHMWFEEALEYKADGALFVFSSREDRWSYSREDELGWVVEVREKQAISEWASTGTYWFRRGADFVKLAERCLKDGRKECNEHYVGPLFNDLIKDGGRVKNFRVDKVLCFGTPQDLYHALATLDHLRIQK